jgi:heme/copper-type cytochrome/quinol oxidase subunit 2
MSALPHILACATCLPDQSTEVAQAANMAILFMVAVVAVMLGTLVKIMFNFARRQRRATDSQP